MSIAFFSRHTSTHLIKGLKLSFTPRGKIWAIFGLLSTFLALITGNFYLGFLGMATGASLALDALGAWFNQRYLELAIEPPPKIFAQEKVSFAVALAHKGPCFALYLQTPYGSLALPYFYVLKKINLCLIFPKRGLYQISPVAKSNFPLGFFDSSRRLKTIKIVVFPRPEPARWEEFNLYNPKGLPKLIPGEEILGHGFYSGREPVTRIDWKATARQQNLMVKNFGGLSQTPILNLDATPGNQEILRQKACFLVLKAARENKKMGLLLNGQLYPPGTPPQKLLEVLALA